MMINLVAFTGYFSLLAFFFASLWAVKKVLGFL